MRPPMAHEGEQMASAVVARWELCRRLVGRRKRLGIDVKTITTELSFTRNYWSAVENDRTLIAEDKLRGLFDLLEFDEAEQVELIDLRNQARERSWWDQYGDVMAPEALRFIGLEDGAESIETFSSLVLPALLQTEAYSRSVLSFDPSVSQLKIDQLLDMRSRRIAGVLDNADPARYFALISEAAIAQRWSDAATHRAQLDHLVEWAESGLVEIRLLPQDQPPGLIANASALVHMAFVSEHLTSVFWQEPVRPLTIIEDGDGDYVHLATCMVDGTRRALTPDGSIDLVKAHAVNLLKP